MAAQRAKGAIQLSDATTAQRAKGAIQLEPDTGAPAADVFFAFQIAAIERQQQPTTASQLGGVLVE